MQKKRSNMKKRTVKKRSSFMRDLAYLTVTGALTLCTVVGILFIYIAVFVNVLDYGVVKSMSSLLTLMVLTTLICSGFKWLVRG